MDRRVECARTHLTLRRCTWFGRLEKPTQEESVLRMTLTALDAEPLVALSPLGVPMWWSAGSA